MTTTRIGSTNGGQWNNQTDSYTHNANTQTDFTIRAEVYNEYSWHR